MKLKKIFLSICLMMIMFVPTVTTAFASTGAMIGHDMGKNDQPEQTLMDSVSRFFENIRVIGSFAKYS